MVIETSSAADSTRPHLMRERFHHVVTLPVLGKKSVVGTLSLGSRHRLSYTPDDMEFLVTSAHQLGLAVENLRLVEQILRSHRQWANTFDSIQDLVLVHDAEFVVMKANMALLQRLGQAPADVIGQSCEAVLPRHGQWAGCPYCAVSYTHLTPWLRRSKSESWRVLRRVRGANLCAGNPELPGRWYKSGSSSWCRKQF